jgi:hypothetical protein
MGDIISSGSAKALRSLRRKKRKLNYELLFCAVSQANVLFPKVNNKSKEVRGSRE